jgi:hypothetical protein
MLQEKFIGIKYKTEGTQDIGVTAWKVKMTDQTTEEIVKYTKNLHELLEACYIDEDVYELRDLQVMRDRLSELIEREGFWINRENPSKFLAELKNHVSWQANYMEKVFDLWEIKNS